jgi:hypothetical protein
LDLPGVDLIWHHNRGQRVQAIGRLDEQLELERFQPRPQARCGVRVPVPALRHALFHQQTQRFAQGIEQENGRGVMIPSPLRPVVL